MTRINVVPPKELSNLHLVAEYRELPRVFGLVKKAIVKGVKPDDESIPEAYTMGPGHVKFFYNKLGYLAERQDAIVRQMILRGMNPRFTKSLWVTEFNIHWTWWGLWEPDSQALALNRERILQRS